MSNATPRVAVITAAGYGSRLGRDQPKALVSVDGMMVIERQLELLAEIPEVRVVVGFKADLVRNVVHAIRPDAIIVENREFARTNVLQSVFAAVRDLDEPFLCIDGDLVIHPDSFSKFLQHCSQAGVVGLTPTGTEEPVCSIHELGETDDEYVVTGFTRDYGPLEWTGLSYLHSSWITNERIYVFEAISRHLPMQGRIVAVYEIDTESDFELALQAVTSPLWTASAAEWKAKELPERKSLVTPQVHISN